MSKPQFYDCGICGAMHSAAWDGDCRQDDARFFPEMLDARYGWDGWEEVDMEDVPASMSPARFQPGQPRGLTADDERFFAEWRAREMTR